MPKRLSLRSKFALGALMSAALLSGTVPLQNPRVRSVGELLTCQCGCGATITSCNMQECHFASPERERLLKMVEAGMTDDQILAQYERDFGKVILQKPPAQGFYLLSWIMPYAALGGGLALIWLILQRYMTRRTASVAASASSAQADSEELARYRARIEKEMADLDK